MFARLPFLCLILFCITSPRLVFAHFHTSIPPINNDISVNLPIHLQQKPLLPPIAANRNSTDHFSTLLQRRILQILAHQLIDDSKQFNKKNIRTVELVDTHYKTNTFSVSIDTINTTFYQVRIKDNLKQQETLIRIPR